MRLNFLDKTFKKGSALHIAYPSRDGTQLHFIHYQKRSYEKLLKTVIQFAKSNRNADNCWLFMEVINFLFTQTSVFAVQTENTKFQSKTQLHFQKVLALCWTNWVAIRTRISPKAHLPRKRQGKPKMENQQMIILRKIHHIRGKIVWSLRFRIYP